MSHAYFQIGLGLILLCHAMGEVTWQWRHPLPQGNKINKIIPGKTGLIAVGDGGCVLRSEDGWKWRAGGSGTRHNLRGIVWTGSRYVAVGGGGAVLTSPDGIAWQWQRSDTRAALYDIAWSGRELLAVGEGGAVLRSENGKRWRFQKPVKNAEFLAVFWSGGQWIILGKEKKYYRSSDGRNWQTTQEVILFNPTDISFNAQMAKQALIHVDSGGMWFLQDGASWRRPAGMANLRGATTACWLDEKLVAADTYGMIYISEEGIAWQAVFRYLHPYLPNLNQVIWDDSSGRFIAAGDSGFVVTSGDGRGWDLWPSDIEADFQHVTKFGGKLYLADDGGNLYLADAAGQIKQLPPHSDIGLTIFEPAGPWLISFNEKGLLQYSLDGLNWHKNYPLQRWRHMCMVRKGRRFYAGGLWGHVWSSAKGVNWEKTVDLGAAPLTTLAANDSLLVAADSVGGIYTSEKGEHWQARYSGVEKRIDDMVWTGAQFLAVGKRGLVLSSPAGRYWTEEYSGTLNRLRSIARKGNMLAAVGDNGTIMTSVRRQPKTHGGGE